MTLPGSYPAISLKQRIVGAQDFIAAGRLDEAEALLSEVLEEAPSSAEALNALGGIALTRKDAARAEEILAAAATAFPDDSAIVNNLGIAHQLAGRLDEAIICFERAAALTPQADAPLQSLATTRFLANDFPGARAAAEQILARTPEAADAIGLLGLIALANREIALAETHLRRAVELNPTDAASLRALSACCYEGKRFEEALHLAERARLAAPLDIDTLEHLARCEATLGRYAAAETTCRKVLAFAPNHLDIREILARVLVATGRPDEGIAEVTKTVRANPKSTEALIALASTLRYAGRLDQAMPFVEHALKLKPDSSAALLMKTELTLARGDFPERVEGEGPLPSQIVVPAEMRAPEFILFGRFLSRLSAQGETVRLAADERFWPIAAHLDVPVELPEAGSQELSVALPSLMRYFDLDAASVAEDIPYLKPAPQLEQRWLAALSEYPRPWIGLVWDGRGAGVTMEQMRAAMPPFGTAISLMTGQGRHDLAGWPEAVDAGRHLDGFDAMIAAIAGVDVVVGPDVSALHLAGALARPGLVAVPAGYPWHWAARHGRSLWYPTIEVVPQNRPGSWEDVIETLRAILTERFRPSLN